ncbi:NAD(P)-binding domain-containing protein [Streptomyces sp. NPDC048564]|uniref:flavin-containing monooxygenase n=1 Tax=Streptomyces sp. NPDC048564 TaxID=3155760 RepID=UPI0034298724
MGWQPVILEAADRPAGSWPRYYDSLTLFSPARCGSLPEMPFDGDLDRCPHRDVVITCLLRYTDRLDADIRTRTRVLEVSYGDGAFGLSLEDGSQLEARAAVAATGAFGRPHRPDLPGLAGYAGAVLHSANYRSPEPFTGQRVVVVGAGNSAVQRAAECARVTPAARHAVRFARQRTLGRYLHLWLARTGLDTQAVGRFLSTPPTQPVIDDGRYRRAVIAGRPDRRPLFTGISETKVIRADGAAEDVDTILLATSYRPDLGRLAPLGTFSTSGHPRHREGVPLAHPGLVHVGLGWQRSLPSNSLRGVGRDAVRAVRHVAAHLAHIGEAGLGSGRAG